MSRRGLGNYSVLLGNFWRKPSTRMLTPEARSLYCDALAYAADNLTDGIVPKHALEGMHVAMRNALPIAMPLAMLTAMRGDDGAFWIDHGDSVEIVGYLDLNMSKAELRAKSAKNRKAAESRWKEDAEDAGTQERDASGNAKRNASGIAKCTTPPDPLTPYVERETRARASDSDWVLALRVFDHAWEVARGQQLGLEAAAFKNRREGESLVAWARGAAGDGWLDKLRELSKHALADPFVSKSKFPLAAVSKSPGSIGPAPEAAPPPPKTREDILREIREHNARVPRMGT